MHVCLLNLITTLATIENGDSDKKWDLESDSFTVFIGLSALPVGKHPHLPLSPPPTLNKKQDLHKQKHDYYFFIIWLAVVAYISRALIS